MNNRGKCFVCNLSIGFISFFALCSCNHQLSKAEINNMEHNNWDSVMQRQKLFAQDSITRLGDKIFSNFFFGMSKKEYEKAESIFKKETNGYVKIENLKFILYNPSFKEQKLSCLTLGASDVIESINGLFISTDYFSILKERYQNRLGIPDSFLDEDYQECDSTNEKLTHMIWVFDNRVFHLSFSKHLIREGWLEKNYWLYYSTKEDWIETKETFDSIYHERLRLENERNEKDKKYSNEL